MGLESKYKIPYTNLCTGRQEVLKEFDIKENLRFSCDSNIKYSVTVQVSPIFNPISFSVVGAKLVASVVFSIPYIDNEESYLDDVISDVNGILSEFDGNIRFSLDKSNLQNVSKNVNPNLKTGLSPVVTQNVSFRQEDMLECDTSLDKLPILVTIKSDIFYKIIKIKELILTN